MQIKREYLSSAYDFSFILLLLCLCFPVHSGTMEWTWVKYSFGGFSLYIFFVSKRTCLLCGVISIFLWLKKLYITCQLVFLWSNIWTRCVFSLHLRLCGLWPSSFHQKCVHQGHWGPPHCWIQWPALSILVSLGLSAVFGSVAHSIFLNILCPDLASWTTHSLGRLLPSLASLSVCSVDSCSFPWPLTFQGPQGSGLALLPFSPCMHCFIDLVLSPAFQYHSM